MGSAAVTIADPTTSVVMPLTGSIQYCLSPEISEDGYRGTAPSVSRARSIRTAINWCLRVDKAAITSKDFKTVDRKQGTPRPTLVMHA